MRIGILETGRPPDELIGKFGSYADMVANWLKPVSEDIAVFDIQAGAMPESTDQADLWTITGSRCAVYEPHPWIAPLEDFVRKVRADGGKMFGICFGHQIMARAFGGRVEKSGKGWGLGVHSYETLNWPSALQPQPARLSMQTFHQDQVTVPPEDGIVIGRSDFCPYAALHYPGFGMSVQGHPEFLSDYARDLLAFRRGVTLPPDTVDEALPTVDLPNTSAEMAQLLAKGWRGL
ncbi:MAG: type 1 glutamine amidotransferase [Hyphomicrobiaceae bacterium]|nr:type 1 glutamine amidotransferase [Hyphomicrobiaceae bacterium]